MNLHDILLTLIRNRSNFQSISLQLNVSNNRRLLQLTQAHQIQKITIQKLQFLPLQKLFIISLLGMSAFTMETLTGRVSYFWNYFCKYLYQGTLHSYTYTVSCQGVVKLLGLVPGYPWEVKHRKSFLFTTGSLK